MKCKECKYYFNGTCSTGVFKDLDDSIVKKLGLSCNSGSLNKRLSEQTTEPNTSDASLNIGCVSQQRELLIAYDKWSYESGTNESDQITHEEAVDLYLSNLQWHNENNMG